MATTVYTTEEILLSDETTVTLRPLNLKNLRTFMKIMDKFGKAENEDEGLDVLMDAAGICLSKERPEFWNGEKHTEDLEEVLDMQTVYKVLDVCGGVKLNDPNLLAAAAAALGQNSTSQD